MKAGRNQTRGDHEVPPRRPATSSLSACAKAGLEMMAARTPMPWSTSQRMKWNLSIEGARARKTSVLPACSNLDVTSQARTRVMKGRPRRIPVGPLPSFSSAQPEVAAEVVVIWETCWASHSSDMRATGCPKEYEVMFK
jgi:hypothetical protein